MVIYESDEWDFSICSVNKKSLPTAFWWVVCQNIHAWCPHASAKDLKRFLSVLIHTSLPFVRSSFEEIIELKNHEADRLKNVALHQISSECFIDSSLYEQRVSFFQISNSASSDSRMMYMHPHNSCILQNIIIFACF